MLHSLRRLERWKLIKIKEEENSEDMLVLPSSALITPFSAEENNIEWCDVRSGWFCVKVHSESSADERFLRKQKIFVRVKGKKGRRSRRLGCCFCLLFAGSAGIFPLHFWHRSMVRSDELIEKENIIETAQIFFFPLIDLFKRTSAWRGKKKLTTFREPSRIRILL